MSNHEPLSDGQAREIARAHQERRFGAPLRRFTAHGEIGQGLVGAIQLAQAQCEPESGEWEQLEELGEYVNAVGHRPPVDSWQVRP